VLNHYSILENIITTNQLKHQNMHPKLNMLIKLLLSNQVSKSFIGDIPRLINSIHHNLKWKEKQIS
jgi:hypothetical protein